MKASPSDNIKINVAIAFDVVGLLFSMTAIAIYLDGNGQPIYWLVISSAGFMAVGKLFCWAFDVKTKPEDCEED